MPIRSERITVDETADKVADSRDAADFILTNRHATDSVDLGAQSVTTGTGYELKAGESLDVTLKERNNDLYAVAAAGKSVSIHVLKQ